MARDQKYRYESLARNLNYSAVAFPEQFQSEYQAHTFTTEYIRHGDLIIEMSNETVHGDEALDMMGIDRDWFHGLFQDPSA